MNKFNTGCQLYEHKWNDSAEKHNDQEKQKFEDFRPDGFGKVNYVNAGVYNHQNDC